jgi:hypothetical protein
MVNKSIQLRQSPILGIQFQVRNQTLLARAQDYLQSKLRHNLAAIEIE